MAPSTKKLRQLESKFVQSERLTFDPLHLLDRNLQPEDQELVAFLIAGLSYGRVEQIQRATRDLLQRLNSAGAGPNGEGLRSLILAATSPTDSRLVPILAGWKHRLNTGKDILELFVLLSAVLKTYGSLKSLMGNFDAKKPSERIERFAQSLEALHIGHSGPKKGRRTQWDGTGPGWFFANPTEGSSCKRLMLYLRWMIRDNAIDPGTWRKLDAKPLPLLASELFIPLDVHVFRWAQKHRITRYKSPSWKAVVEISDFFRKKDPADPLRYDFAIFQESFVEVRTRNPGRKGAARRKRLPLNG